MTPARILPLLATAIACLFAPLSQAADDYPSRSVRVIINSSPGGLTDVVGRLVTNRLSTQLNQQFVVDNRAGQAVIGADALAKARPDGYTIGVLGNSLSALPALLPSMPFNAEKDLIPVALLNSSQLVLVTNVNSGLRSVADFVKAAKSKPGMAFASGGVATMGHLLAEQLMGAAALDMTHVPYKGGAPAMADILAGHVPVFFDTVGTTTPLAREGRVRPLAIAGNKRSPTLPDVPSLAEAGYPTVEGMGWFAMFAPAGVPADMIAKLNSEINKALQTAEVRDRMVTLGTNVEGGSPKVLSDLLASELPRWAKLIKERGIKMQ